MRNLMTCLSCTCLCSTCLLPKAGHSAAVLPSGRCLPSDPSLQKVCMLTDSPGPATGDVLLPHRLLLVPTQYLHLLAAQDQSRCCCSSSPALLLQTVVQQDCCQILVVNIPTLRNSCFFLSFLLLIFPSPSPQAVTVSVLPFLHLPY